MRSIDLTTFESWAITTKENKTAILVEEMHLAHFAVEHDRIHKDKDPPPRLARWLAHLSGQSTVHGINVLARMAEIFSDEDILPNVPLSLYNAVMETDNPHYALRLATDYKFRRQELGEEFAKADKKGTWSSRDVRNHFDILKGRHLSSAAFRGRVPVTRWDVPTGTLAVEGLRLSGAAPELVDITAREVLQ